ncbi:MAG: PIN domain-containing protein, partial [Vulcanimicrobiaceae bacterium]
LYWPRWSAQILAEARRSLVDDGRCTAESAEWRFRLICDGFPEAEVTGYEHLVADLRCDAGDRHVLAAAIRGRVDQIVTQNLKHFPDEAVSAYFIEVVSPDDFLLNALDLYPRELAEIIREQAAALKRPPMGVDDVLRALSPVAPMFVQQVETIIRALE